MNSFQALHGEEHYQRDFDVSLEQQEGNNTNPMWGFGELIKNRLQTFFRSFEEVCGDLKEMAEEMGEVASLTLELGVRVAQESLQSVGQAIEECGSFARNATARIISCGDYANFAGDSESDSSDHDAAQSIKTDIRTYYSEPEDLNDFNEWKSGFVLEEKTQEIEALIGHNKLMNVVYGKLVPRDIDRETFWTRYFYRFYKLEQMENARALLVNKTISGVEEEKLSWQSWDADSDDETIDCGNGSVLNAEQSVAESEENTSPEGKRDVDESGRNSDFSIVSHPSFTGEEDDFDWDQLEGLNGNEKKKESVDEEEDDLIFRGQNIDIHYIK